MNADNGCVKIESNSPETIFLKKTFTYNKRLNSEIELLKLSSGVNVKVSQTNQS